MTKALKPSCSVSMRLAWCHPAGQSALPGLSTTAVEEKKIPEDRPVRGHPANSLPLDDVEWKLSALPQSSRGRSQVGIFAMRKELIGGTSVLPLIST